MAQLGSSRRISRFEISMIAVSCAMISTFSTKWIRISLLKRLAQLVNRREPAVEQRQGHLRDPLPAILVDATGLAVGFKNSRQRCQLARVHNSIRHAYPPSCVEQGMLSIFFGNRGWRYRVSFLNGIPCKRTNVHFKLGYVLRLFLRVRKDLDGPGVVLF